MLIALSSHGSSRLHSYISTQHALRFTRFSQSRTLILEMVTEPPPVPSKRSTCSSCSKPTRICLCNRLKTPILHNAVAITILQHSLERKHPLNSAKIATIGLKNVDVFMVSDVNFQARFFIWFPDGTHQVELGSNNLFDKRPSEGNIDDCVETSEYTSAEMEETYGDDDRLSSLQDSKFLVSSSMNSDSGNNVEVSSRSCKFDEVFGDENKVNGINEFMETISCTTKRAALQGYQGIAIDFGIEKYGAVSFFNCFRAPPSNKLSITNFDEFLASYVASNDIRKGFTVKRLQRKPIEESDKYKESKEFAIAIPPGSALLFPSEESVNVEDVDFEVRNLIVLDGTWAKAKRMYNENPWLKMLPHIRLDINKLSLYSEVRHQPRAGYLSTIESIVYGLKGIGEDSEVLDGLLDVFESMIGDQRQCKKERLSKESEISPSATHAYRNTL